MEIDETEDEANNIIMNKNRRLNGSKKFGRKKQKSIDNDNPIMTNDEQNYLGNAQDADADFMGGIAATHKARKRRERAGTSSNNEAF